MGIIIECGEQEVWAPGPRVGHLFIDQIAALERLVEQHSGIEPGPPDMWTIDAPTFQAFIDAVLAYPDRTNNGPLFALVAGPLKIALALNGRITGRWPDVPDPLRAAIVDGAKTVLYRVRLM